MLKRHLCVIDLKSSTLGLGSAGASVPFLSEKDLPSSARETQASRYCRIRCCCRCCCWVSALAPNGADRSVSLSYYHGVVSVPTSDAFVSECPSLSPPLPIAPCLAVAKPLTIVARSKANALISPQESKQSSGPALQAQAAICYKTCLSEIRLKKKHRVRFRDGCAFPPRLHKIRKIVPPCRNFKEFKSRRPTILPPYLPSVPHPLDRTRSSKRPFFSLSSGGGSREQKARRC